MEQEAVALFGEDWSQTYPCVTPLCRGRLKLVDHEFYARLRRAELVKRTEKVKLEDFYRAVHGFGPVTGDAAPVDLVTELLLTKKIVEVQANPIGQPQRTILRQLVLEDGTRLHFSRSTRGACLHYVEQPEETPDGQVGDDGAQPDEVCAEEREEAGRGAEAAEGRQTRDPAAGAEVPGAGVPAVQSAEDVPPYPGDGS
jgi:hypothetical protein